MQHPAAGGFWHAYNALPPEIRSRADKQFLLLKANPRHPSLQFKKVGERHNQEIWPARVTLNYRALAIRRTDAYLWFWIGDRKTYGALAEVRHLGARRPLPAGRGSVSNRKHNSAIRTPTGRGDELRLVS